uniref:Metallothionein n=1 Tax=Bombyx mori TaxID=7091 RepID=A0A7M1IL42_BOMMO|nr:metallothionein [Bombyx mori]
MPCGGCGDDCKCTINQCCQNCKCDSSCICSGKKPAPVEASKKTTKS